MIRRLSSKLIYENPWLKLREDEVEFPNGHRGIYGVVDKVDFALVLPFANGGFHLVRQYRYPVQRRSWEFPQGTAPGRRAEDPLVTARHELKEETGCTAEHWTKLGFLYAAYGLSSQGMHVFLAEGLNQGEQELEETESDLETRWFSLADFDALIDSGELIDGPTVAAYALYLRKYRLG